MRITVFENGGNAAAGFTSNGGILTGPLILNGIAGGSDEAIHRGYVDASINTHSGSNLHLTSSEKAFLSSISVNSTEINRLSGVTENIQESLNGKVNLAGDTLTGFLTLNQSSFSSRSLVNKEYLTTVLSGLVTVNAGTIVSLPQDTPPVGYLRANGAAVSQSTFSSLFSVVGHRFAEEVSTASTFTTNAALGAGAPWEQQFGFNNATGLGAFTSAGTLPINLHANSVVVTQNRVFLLGGHNGAATINAIFSAVIQTDGMLGVFTSVGTLPVNLHSSSVVVTRNRVFLLGGHNGSSGINTIFSAAIQADGTLSAFTSVGTLPVNLFHSSAIVTSSRVFLLGVHNEAASINTIFSAVIQADGTLGAFTAIGTLPSNLSHSSVAVTQNRVFLLGGFNSPTYINTILSAPINADGTLGAFITAGSIPSVLTDAAVLVTSSRVFLIGGDINGHSTASISSAPINADGTLGAFTSSGTLPVVLQYSSLIATSSRVFLLGGFTTAAINTIFSAPLIGGSGLNDYSRFYNGSINTFNGAPLSGAIVVFTRNPDRNTLFMLPDASQQETLIPGVFRFIKT